MGGLAETRTAVIEMAEASALHLVPASKRDATHASTFGTGQLVHACVNAAELLRDRAYDVMSVWGMGRAKA